jgi:hypothetical protein
MYDVLLYIYFAWNDFYLCQDLTKENNIKIDINVRINRERHDMCLMSRV